jgi:hypothetical protein
VKDQAAQLRLLRAALDKELRARREDEKQTAELLGNDHDLWILHERLGAMSLPQRLARTREILGREIQVRREQLQREAFEMGEAFCSVRPNAFAAAVGAAWGKASRRKSKQERAGRRRGGGAGRRGATSPMP